MPYRFSSAFLLLRLYSILVGLLTVSKLTSTTYYLAYRWSLVRPA